MVGVDVDVVETEGVRLNNKDLGVDISVAFLSFNGMVLCTNPKLLALHLVSGQQAKLEANSSSC